MRELSATSPNLWLDLLQDAAQETLQAPPPSPPRSSPALPTLAPAHPRLIDSAVRQGAMKAHTQHEQYLAARFAAQLQQFQEAIQAILDAIIWGYSRPGEVGGRAKSTWPKGPIGPFRPHDRFKPRLPEQAPASDGARQSPARPGTAAARTEPAPTTAAEKTAPKTDASKTDAPQPGGPQPGAPQPGAPQPGAPTSTDAPVRGAQAFTPNAKAVQAAKETSLGKLIERKTAQNAHIYKEASQRTGVPASMIAAIHFNEGHMGSGVGPESGFGLDPAHIKTGYGNSILAKHGMGPWERGTGSERSKLQSAVIAAEVLKTQAAAAGAKVGPNMTEKDYAVAIHAYGTGSGSRFTKTAQETGRGFMFDPSDDQPHPYHPGGSSAAADGSRIRVPPGYKKGLLRWDVVIPMIDEQLA